MRINDNISALSAFKALTQNTNNLQHTSMLAQANQTPQSVLSLLQ